MFQEGLAHADVHKRWEALPMLDSLPARGAWAMDLLVEMNKHPKGPSGSGSIAGSEEALSGDAGSTSGSSSG